MGKSIEQKQDREPGHSVKVRLAPHDSTSQPLLANFTQVGVAQGLAYLDFGFVEPAVLAVVGQPGFVGEAKPACVEGARAARVALPLDTLIRLQQQVQQVLSRLQSRPAKIS